MKQKDIEDRVRQISWPGPSPNLRDRVLSIAVIAQQPITWSDRIWFSRAWRLAAVGVALAIVLFDQLSSSTRPAAYTPTPQVLAEAKAIDEAVREMGLSQEVAAALARRVLSDASRMSAQPQSNSDQLQEFTRESGGD